MSHFTMIGANELCQLMNRDNYRLIDIRENDEYADGHINTSINVPLSQMQGLDLDLEAEQKLVFYCRSGKRTEANQALLAKCYNQEAYILSGGLTAWGEAGYKINRTQAA